MDAPAAPNRLMAPTSASASASNNPYLRMAPMRPPPIKRSSLANETSAEHAYTPITTPTTSSGALSPISPGMQGSPSAQRSPALSKREAPRPPPLSEALLRRKSNELLGASMPTTPRTAPGTPMSAVHPRSLQARSAAASPACHSAAGLSPVALVAQPQKTAAGTDAFSLAVTAAAADASAASSVAATPTTASGAQYFSITMNAQGQVEEVAEDGTVRTVVEGDSSAVACGDYDTLGPGVSIPLDLIHAQQQKAMMSGGGPGGGHMVRRRTADNVLNSRADEALTQAQMRRQASRGKLGKQASSGKLGKQASSGKLGKQASSGKLDKRASKRSTSVPGIIHPNGATEGPQRRITRKKRAASVDGMRRRRGSQDITPTRRSRASSTASTKSGKSAKSGGRRRSSLATIPGEGEEEDGAYTKIDNSYECVEMNRALPDLAEEENEFGKFEDYDDEDAYSSEDDEEFEELPPLQLTIAVMGRTGVGKSCMTVQYVDQSDFVEEYEPTVEDHYHKEAMIKEELVNVTIVDTSGQEEQTAMHDSYLREVEGFCFVYAINDQASFDFVKEMADNLLRIRETARIPIVLVENKTDLEAERVVSLVAGRELADKLNCTLFSASAKAGVNVHQTFLEVIDRCYTMRKPDMAGWIRIKTGGKGLFSRRRWRRRWFELMDDCLTYRRSPKARDIIGLFMLENISSVYKTKIDDVGTDWFLAVDKKTVSLRSASREDRANWINQVQLARPAGGK